MIQLFPKAAEVQLTLEDFAVLEARVRAPHDGTARFRARAGLTDKPRNPVGS